MDNVFKTIDETNKEVGIFQGGTKIGPLTEANLLTGIVVYEELEESCEDLLLVSFATFIIDFGPWKKGEMVDTLALHTWTKLNKHAIPIIETTTIDGSNSKICQVKLIPLEI